MPDESNQPKRMTLPPKLLDTPRTRIQRSRYLQEVKDLDEFGDTGMNSLLTERFMPPTPPNPFEIKCENKKEE